MTLLGEFRSWRQPQREACIPSTFDLSSYINTCDPLSCAGSRAACCGSTWGLVLSVRQCSNAESWWICCLSRIQDRVMTVQYHTAVRQGKNISIILNILFGYASLLITALSRIRPGEHYTGSWEALRKAYTICPSFRGESRQVPIGYCNVSQSSGGGGNLHHFGHCTKYPR